MWRWIVRVPLADTSAVKAPQGVSPRSLVLMADIFPVSIISVEPRKKREADNP